MPIFVIALAGIYLIAGDTVLFAARVVVWMVVAALGVLLGSSAAAAVFYVKIAREKALEQKERRHKTGREIITTQDGQVYVRETDHHATYRALHSNPHWYVNGKQTIPTQAELDTFQAHLMRNRKQEPLMIEGQSQAIEQRRTIFNIVDTGIHFFLVGGTDTGKTTLANHIIDYMKIVDTYVCDPHTKFNTWSNLARIIRKYDEIEAKVTEIHQELDRRYDPNTPLVFFPILLVIDEYPKVAQKCDISRMITEISSEGRKVKIFLILMSQSSLVQDTDLSTAMQDNFIKIMLNAELTQRNEAYIRHWTKEKELITLAGPYHREPSIEERIIKGWAAVDKSDPERAVGIVTKSVFFPNDGGNQRDRVRRILRENGLYDEEKNTPN